MPHRLITTLRSISLFILLTVAGLSAQALTNVVYVADTGLQSVSAINTSTNAVVATVPVSNAGAIAASPDGTRVYVTSYPNPFYPWSVRNVVAIDTATNSIVATIPVSGPPQRMVVSPDSSRLYVIVLSTPNGVAVIDTTSNALVATISVPVDGLRFDPVVSPNGSRLYIPNYSHGDIYVADTATNTVIDTITDTYTGQLPGCLAMTISPNGSRLYAENHGGNLGVSVIDTATKAEIATIPATKFWTMTITPDGSKIYATGIPDDGPFFVLDTVALTSTTIGDYSRAWWQAAITPDGAYAYLTDEAQSAVVKFDTATNTQQSLIQLPTFPNPRDIPQGIVISQVPSASDATPFSALSVSTLTITSSGYTVKGNFTLQSGAKPINPVTEPVTLTIGTYTLLIPNGFFLASSKPEWKFSGSVGSTTLNCSIKAAGSSGTSYQFSIVATGPDLTGQTHPITVGLAVYTSSGTTVVP